MKEPKCEERRRGFEENQPIGVVKVRFSSCEFHCIGACVGSRQLEGEPASFTQPAFHAEDACKSNSHSFGHRQPQADAANAQPMRLRRTVERLEDVRQFVGGDAATLVRDGQVDKSTFFPEFNTDRRPGGTVLGRIVEKVAHQLAEQRRLRLHPAGSVKSDLEFQVSRPRRIRPRR